MKTILSTIVLGSLLAFSQTSSAQVTGGVHIRIGPPVARHEVRTARPDVHAIWVPGYQEYDAPNSAYVWRPGKWDHAPRKGARWIAPRYRREKGEYKYKPGRWK